MPAEWSAGVRTFPALTHFEGSVSAAFPLAAVTLVQNVGRRASRRRDQVLELSASRRRSACALSSRPSCSLCTSSPRRPGTTTYLSRTFSKSCLPIPHCLPGECGNTSKTPPQPSRRCCSPRYPDGLRPRQQAEVKLATGFANQLRCHCEW